MLKALKRVKPFLTLQNGIAAGVLGITLIAFLTLRYGFNVDIFSAEGFKTFIDSLSWGGPIVYIFIIAIAVVISQIPGVPLTVAAGALWGPLPAGLYSVIGGFLGSLTAYYLSRTLGRSAMKALTGRVVTFNESKGEVYLGVLIFVTRLLPLFPFDIVSYAAGLSGLSLRVYAVATLLGMIPSTLLLTYLGATFMISVPVALGLSGVAIIILAGLPLIIRRFNWFDLRDSIRLE